MAGTLTVIKPHKIGAFTFDTTFFEQHTATIRITEQPIELGAEISDHAFVQPLRLTVGVAVSDVALRPNPSFKAATTNSRSASAYQQLLTFMNQRSLISVQTGLANYSNMIIETLDAAQDKDNPDTLDCVLSLRQLFIVSVQNVSVPVQFLAPTVQNIATTTVQNGSQLTIPPTPQQVSALEKFLKLPYPTGKV